MTLTCQKRAAATIFYQSFLSKFGCDATLTASLEVPAEGWLQWVALCGCYEPAC